MKYVVTAKMTSLCTLEVDADSEDEAREIAENTDGAIFEANEDPNTWGWELVKVEKKEEVA